MIYHLENAYLQLAIHPGLSRWSVVSRQRGDLALEEVQVAVVHRDRWRRFHALDRWRAPHISATEASPSPHGTLRQVSVHIGLEEDELRYTLTFALPEERPFLLWKLAVENQGTRPVWIDRLELLSAGFIFHDRAGPRGALRLSPRLDAARSARLAEARKTSARRAAPRLIPLTLTEYAFFSNGWQSWSYTGAYGPGERFRHTRLGPIRAPTDVNAGTPQPRRADLYASDMFGILGDRAHRNGVLAGFLSQKQHFGSLEALTYPTAPALSMWANGDGARLDPGALMVTDWAYLQLLHLDEPDPLGTYIEAVAREHGITESGSPNYPRATPTGWCSWYQFFSEQYLGTVTAQDVRGNTEAIARLHPDLPLEIVQIDDGFEAQVGDWFSFAPSFPAGLAPLAAEIRTAGLTPGLWLAPFIVHPRARLVADHPDWLLRGRLGRPANASFLWNTFATALDLTHPDALAYAVDVVHTAVHEWGYPYLKLDFLYAAALPGRRRDPTRTRAQVLRTALEALRAAAGEEAFLLGCGCPLGPAIGLVEAMRVSTDTTPRWNPSFLGSELFFKSEPNLPSARNALHNDLTRAALHRRWWINDPDCLLLRPDTRLSLTEVQTVATVIALTGGALLLSDDLPALPAERLRIAKTLLPLIGLRPHVLDWFDSATPTRLQLDLDGPTGPWHLLAVFNWEDQARDLELRLNEFYLDSTVEYIGREFWSGETHRPQGGRLTLNGVPAHGAALLALRPYRPYRPQYIGSDLHISQGQEVISWAPGGSSGEGAHTVQTLALRLERPGQAEGTIELGLPRPPRTAWLDGQDTPWQASGEGRYLFPLQFNRAAQLHLEF